MKLALIAAIDENNGIGKNNQLLCHLPADLKHFKQLTTGHTIIMGRKTFESLPNGPLPNRKNIVITRNTDFLAHGCFIIHTVNQAIEICREDSYVFVIGGEQIYREFLRFAEIIYLTRIKHSFNADAFFPQFNSDQWQMTENIDHSADDRNKFSFSFQTYILPEEFQNI